MRMRPPTLDKRHACTPSGPAAYQNIRRPTPRHSPPCPSAFTATIELAKLRAETLAKRRPWYNTAARDPSVKTLAAGTPGS